MTFRTALPTFLVATFLGACSAVAEVPISTYQCHSITESIVIDGVLAEQAWQNAEPTPPFPRYTGEATDEAFTVARLMWDDAYLYVAFECTDRDLYATYPGRDDHLWEQDVVEVFIMDETSTEGYYLEYEVSPMGTLFDTYVLHPSPGIRSDMAWTSDFQAGVTAVGTLNNPADTDATYTVEMAIPLVDIYGTGPCPSDGDTVRMNLYRIDYDTPAAPGGTGANSELLTWSPTLVGAFHTPDRFGTLTFVESTPVGLLPGDANRDGEVDLADFVALKTNFGITTLATWEQGDFDEDGDVDLADFVLLKTNFGRTDNPDQG